MTSPLQSPPPTQSSQRLQFIDLLRGWSVLVMIETHVVNALLRPELKDQTAYTVLTFANGLVAPSFLFCAGLALAITLSRKWRTYISLQKPFWRYLLRLVFILIVAYSLHLPFFSLKKMIALADVGSWETLFQVDILQTIAVTLFLLVLIAVAVRQENVLLIVSIAVGLIAVFLAPIIWEMDLSSLPIWLRPYLTTQFKSQFPLLPWSAFLIGGTVIGYFYLRAKKDGYERTFVKRLSMVAAAGIMLSLVIEFLPFTVYPNHAFFRASPEFFFVRLGLVVLALNGLWLYEQRRKVSERSVFLLFGQESLLVYVVHLLMVYGYTYEFSFIRYFGPHLNYLQCFGLFGILALEMYLLALVWHWLKGWNRTLAYFVEFVTLAAFVVAFVVKEY